MTGSIDPALTKGAYLIVGPAGSGKTTALCDRYVDLARAGETGILMLVHSRRAARALADSILRRVGSSTDQVRVATWHSFALSLLRQHHRALGYSREPGLLTGPEQFTLVRDLLDAPIERDHWVSFRRQTRLAGFVEELRELVLRAQDALESPEQLEDRAKRAGRDDLVEAARFFRRYLDALDSAEVVDHANVIAQAVALLQLNEPIAREVREQTRHLLVDDYQDVTPAQETLLRELFVQGGSVVVAANEEARIFGFRGASPDSLATYQDHFAPVSLIELGQIHRSASERQAWAFDHLTEEAEAVARECRRLRARDGISYGDIAVIVRRYGAVSRAVLRALERAGVPSVVVGENRPLAAEPALRPMLDLVRAALRVDEREERLPGLLSSPVVGLDAYEVRALRREARLRGTTLSAMVAAPPEDLPNSVRERLRRVGTLFDELRDRVILHGERPDATFWFLWQELDCFRQMVADGDSDALDAVDAFARAVERFADRRPGKTFDDYLAVLEGVEFGPEPWNMPEERRPDAVRLLTAHQAAGDEFEAVIVAGCVEGEFPDQRDRHGMLDVRDLLAPAAPVERLRRRLADERRLFGVAIGRARRRLVLTCARESSQRQAMVPSPLVHLAGVEWLEPPADRDALTRDDAEARARRTLRDPSAGAAERRAALDLLARLPGVDPETWWYEKDWTDTDVPIAPEELRTSYSRLSAYDNCALQYLYQVELGLDPASTHHMLVGTWVHDIVDKAARGELPKTDEALIEALDRVWDPTVFESRAIEHRRRLDSEEMLRRWLRKDGDLDTLASEVAFEFPIDGAIMRGRIDRVVRLGGTMVRLIDYKTGRSAKGQDDIDQDLQLASYYLALKRDPTLNALGEPRYLELAYLGAFWQDGFVRRGVEPNRRPNFEQEAQERLESFVAGIKQERFAPDPSADCRWCKFKSLCPVWPEGDEVAL